MYCIQAISLYLAEVLCSQTVHGCTAHRIIIGSVIQKYWDEEHRGCGRNTVKFQPTLPLEIAHIVRKVMWGKATTIDPLPVRGAASDAGSHHEQPAGIHLRYQHLQEFERSEPPGRHGDLQ